MTPTSVLITFLILGAVIRQITSRVRKRLPKLDGDLVLLVVFAVSFALTWLLDLTYIADLTRIEINQYVDYVGTAMGLTFGASWINDVLPGRGNGA